MACTSCNTPKFASTAKELKDVIVQQLTRTVEKHCEGKVVQDIFPRTIVQAVYDVCTGKYLDKILKEFNHILVPFKGDFKYTALSIPKNTRRKGLVITYTDRLGQNKTYRYEGCNLSSADFSDILNWKELFTEDTYFKPKNLRIEDKKLKLDVVDRAEEVVEVLEVTLPGASLPAINTQIVDRLPHTGDPSTIYLVPFGNDFNKFIWVPSLRRFEPLQGSTNFGGTCVSPSRGKDIFLSSVNLEDGTLRFSMSNGLEYTVELPTSSSVDLKPLEDRIKALEEKEDQDTIFSPEALETALNKLKEKIDALEGKEEFDPSSINSTIEKLKKDVEDLKSKEEFDPTEINNAVKKLKETLESLEDNDTVYNDKELRDRIEALENSTNSSDGLNSLKARVDILEGLPKWDSNHIASIEDRIYALEAREDKDTKYDDTSIKSRLDVLEAKTDSDTIYDDSDLKRRVSALESKPDKDTVYNDAELKNQIKALQDKITALENKPSPEDENYVISGEWIEKNKIILTMKSGQKITITREEDSTPQESPSKLLITYIDESSAPPTDKSVYTELYNIPVEGGMHEMDTDNDFTTEVFLVPNEYTISRIDGPLGTQTPPSTSYDKVENLVLSDGKTYNGWRLHDNSGNGTHLKIYIKKA